MRRPPPKPAARPRAKVKREQRGKNSKATPKRRHEERVRAQARIVSTATQLFAQRGIENVTYGDIARRARLSRPLVYFYFPNLRTLFLEAAHQATLQLHERMNQAVSSTPTGLEAVVAMGRAYVVFQEEEPELFYVCLTSIAPQPKGHLTSPVEELILSLERAMMSLIAEAISRGVRDGSVRADVGDSLTVALSLWAFVQGLVQLSSGHRDTIERFCGLGRKSFLDAGFATLRGALTPPR